MARHLTYVEIAAGRAATIAAHNVEAEAEALYTDLYWDGDYEKDPQGGPSYTNDLMTISGLENYKLSVERMLITSPGELWHRPEYGVGVRDFLNAPDKHEYRSRLRNRIRTHLTKDPRTEKVLKISTSHFPEESKIEVDIAVIAKGITVSIITTVEV